MANPEHLAKLKEGVDAWNKWKEKNHDWKWNDKISQPVLHITDLSNADLSNLNLNGVNFRYCNLDNVNLSGSRMLSASFRSASLINANLRNSGLGNVDLSGANLKDADLREAYLQSSDLFEARFINSDLRCADLRYASLIKTDFSMAQLEGACIYGISVWDIIKDGASQKDLVITNLNQPRITVDDLEIAQFIYLLLNNQKFRDVIESVTSKAVLILGRFTDDRKKVLDGIRNELRKRNFLPILFDFEKPNTRDLTETISILAKLSRFVIADLTDAKSIPQELSHIIPFMPNLPVIPIILHGQREYAMFEHWKPYPWVLPIYEYVDEFHLISTLSDGVIDPAERKVQEIRNS